MWISLGPRMQADGRAHTNDEGKRAEVVDPANHLALALALALDSVAEVAEDEDGREEQDGDLDCVGRAGQLAFTGA